MTALTHDELREMCGAYVLDALDPDERAAFAAHLQTCSECSAEVAALSRVAAALPYATPQVDPPFALRQRVLAQVGAPSGRPISMPAARPPVRSSAFMAGWLSAAALLIVSVSLGTYALGLRQRVGGLEGQLAETIARLDRSERQLAVATRDVQTAQVRLAVLTAPDLLQVNLAGQAVAPGASGRAFWSRSRGLLFAATQLPALPTGKTYQLWFLQGPKSPPISAGLLKPDEGGRVALGFDSPPDLPAPFGFAVSIEPEGGVPAPTGALYLVGTT